MTQDEIFDAARQSHLDVYALGRDKSQFIYRLETFAKLVTEKEREKILAVLRRKPDQQIYKVLDEIRGMK